MDIRNDIINIFEENGVDPSNHDELRDIDSIQYISIIVEIEQLLSIALPDHLLSKNSFLDFDGFVNIIMAECEQSVEGNDSKQCAMLSNENIDY